MRIICYMLLAMIGVGTTDAATECLGTTVELIDCYAEAQEAAEDALNSSYEALVRLTTRRDHAVTEQLRIAQRTWLRFREENCNLYDSLDRANGGFMRAHCILEMTSDRAKVIDQMLGYEEQWH